MANRKKGWETRLREVLDRHASLPAEYGVSDCYLLPDDAVEALTGATIYGRRERCYKTAAGAAKHLRRRGFHTVEEAFAARFQDVPVSLAQRGDIGVTVNDRGEICGGVFTAIGFAVKPEIGGIKYLPVSDVKRAFKVG